MTKHRIPRTTPKKLSIEQYEQRVRRQRKDSSVWRVFTNAYTFEKADIYYTRLYTFINLAYILCDVQDWCMRDANDILSKLQGLKMQQKDKQHFNIIRQAISKALYYLKENSHSVSTNDESQRYVCGQSDLFYFILRMLMDRMGKKKDVLHLIHILRKEFENHNLIFPELDKGRYIFGF